MAEVKIEITDNSAEVLEEFQAACKRALVKCGLAAEGFAKKLCTVDTGFLRNSITWALAGEPPSASSYNADRPNKSGVVRKGSYSGSAPMTSNGLTVYVGTNVEYGVYIENGTGKHYAGGRKTRWSYKDAKGKWHVTGGNTAKPFIQPAVADHVSEFRTIIESELQGN